MDRSEWNKKVAISRWKRVMLKEREKIVHDKVSKAAIYGFLAGDGSVQARNMGSYIKYQIDFFPDDSIMLKTYMGYIKRVYKKIPTIGRRNNMFTVRISSKTIGEDILKEARFGLKTWEVPANLLSNIESKKAWLKAFFSAEGYVNNRVIKIQTVNERGMMQVSTLLNEFSIKHGFYHYKPKNKNHSETHIIMISNKEEMRKFYYKIGFWHSKKMEILKRSISN